jgi:deazaflavin-dependent oxidoreductase (nitroreductase family)
VPKVTGALPGWLPVLNKVMTILQRLGLAVGPVQILVVPGRRSGKPREAILGYFEDGPNLITMAMNGWGAPEPAWWLNLQADPDVTVDLKDGRRRMRGRAAVGEERDRLWARWRGHGDNLDAYATRRPTETAVVVLEPVDAPSAPLS